MEQTWKEKVVLITGAATGIGEKVVRLLLKEDVKHVAVLDVAIEAGKNLENKINSKYGKNKLKFYECDITADEKLLVVYNDAVVAQMGYIDVVINNAGIMNDAPRAYKKQIELNVTALVTNSFKAFEIMRKDEGGRGGTIVNISSVASLCQIPYMPVYFATKSAVNQFSYCIGHPDYYAKTGVRILSICFGATTTALLKNMECYNKNESQELMDSISQFPTQSPDSAARGLIEAFKRSTSGSTWIVTSNKPARDITESVTKAYEIMSEHVYE